MCIRDSVMRVTEQIDALETLGYDPVPFLVVPRVLAGTVMFPVVVAASMIVGVGAGWAASVMLLHLSTPEIVKGLRPVSYTHLRAHETPEHLVCRLLLEK